MDLNRTPFFEQHIAHGAKMVPFAGWEMPLLYSGIIDEHNAVRTSAGIFDVSHMGNIIIRGAGAKEFLRKLLTNNIDLAVQGKGIYSHITRENGTIIDDTIVYNLSENTYLLVPNASTKDKVLEWLIKNISDDTEIIDVSSRIACIAIQGPKAADIAQRMTENDITSSKKFSVTVASLKSSEKCGFLDDILSYENNGTVCMFARTGYTGEDGFEILVENEGASALWNSLIKAGNEKLTLCGLGCRDTLRLEKGMLLSGTDFDGTQTTLQTGPSWVLKTDHEFIGKEMIMEQKEKGEYDVLVAMTTDSRNIPRHGYDILKNGNKIGTVTSGTLSPCLKKGIALGYVPLPLASVGTELEIDIRGRAAKSTVVKTPFV